MTTVRFYLGIFQILFPWKDYSSIVVVVQSPSHVWLFATHGLQDARFLCPLPFPKVCPSSCPLHRWCHPAISSSDAPFSFCPQSFPASGNFSMSQLFTSVDQNTGISASVISPSNQYSGLISLKIDWFDLFTVQRTQESSLAPPFEGINSSVLCLLYGPAFTTVRDI